VEVGVAGGVSAWSRRGDELSVLIGYGGVTEHTMGLVSFFFLATEEGERISRVGEKGRKRCVAGEWWSASSPASLACRNGCSAGRCRFVGAVRE